jgi:hypothetical protein
LNALQSQQFYCLSKGGFMNLKKALFAATLATAAAGISIPAQAQVIVETPMRTGMKYARRGQMQGTSGVRDIGAGTAIATFGWPATGCARTRIPTRCARTVTVTETASPITPIGTETVTGFRIDSTDTRTIRIGRDVSDG